MAEENNVRILAWPEEAARLEHRFVLDEPCPVSVSFDEATPARVLIATDPQRPLAVDMAMRVSAREAIPVCLTVCEPICARSDYRIGIDVFDRSVAAISVRGMTRIYNCDDVRPQKPECVDFKDLQPGTAFKTPFVHKGLVFRPLGAQIRADDLGEPRGQVKLVFPPEGLRVEFRRPVARPSLTLNNYGDPAIRITTFSDGTPGVSLTEHIENEVKTVSIEDTGVTAVNIQGGNNEASLVEICFTPE